MFKRALVIGEIIIPALTSNERYVKVNSNNGTVYIPADSIQAVIDALKEAKALV
jgi:hypothetical protein